MSNLSREIFADKEGFINALQGEVDQHQANVANARLTRRQRDHSRGAIEGLKLAMAYVRDWQVIPMDEPAEPKPSMALGKDDAPHCRHHPVFRSDCAECRSEREFG